MAFTTPATKANGGNITRAELTAFLDNLEWFWRPPCYRLYSTSGNGETVATTLDTMDYADATTPHYEWRIEGGDGSLELGTYNNATGGLWVNVGDVASGVWLNGVMFGVAQVADGVAADSSRRVLLRRGDGTTWTELADFVVEGVTDAFRCGLHVFGIGTFNATTDRVEVQAQQSGLPGSTLDVLTDRRWGVRFGSDTALGDNYAAARQVSDTNNELTGAWNRLRLNQLRIERRPSAQRYKSGADQTISAATETLVTLASSDWASDATIVGAASNVLTAQQAGVYLVQGQATFDAYSDGTGFAVVRLKRNASTNITTANSPGVNNYETVAAVSDIVSLAADDTVGLYVETSASRDVQASRGTYLAMTLLSSNSGVSTGRQVWDRMPDPSTWPDVADMSSERLTAGTLRVLSDLTDRQWHRPAMKAIMDDDVEVAVNGGWTDIDVADVILDYTDLEGTHGYRLTSGGALVLPWAGIWLVGARLTYSAQSSEGANKGGAGTRGMRLALGKNRAVGAVVGRAMNAGANTWTRTICETVVVNRDEGQDVRLQGRIDNPTDFGSIPVTTASIWAVELGAGFTRDPR